MKITKDDIKLIPAVAHVLIEYEKLYNKEKAREMFDIMLEQIVNKINDNKNEKIKQDVNEIIKSLYNKSGKKIKANFKNEPINWGDLRCFAVEEKYVVYISEASPNATEFKNYIKNELEKKGYKNVEIITEW